MGSTAGVEPESVQGGVQPQLPVGKRPGDQGWERQEQTLRGSGGPGEGRKGCGPSGGRSLQGLREVPVVCLEQGGSIPFWQTLSSTTVLSTDSLLWRGKERQAV